MSNECTLDWSGGPKYQVKSPHGAYVVDLEVWTCACKKRDTRNDLEDYVNNCYTVDAYLKCYEKILNLINDKKLWPEISVAMKIPLWSTPYKGRQQRKKRKQVDETYIEHSQTKSILKRKGQVVMTCLECGLQGHNKRYHLRGDAPTPGKLTPRRSSTNASNQPHEAQSGYQFMPTLGVDMRNAGVSISSGPSASSPIIDENSIWKTTVHVIRTKQVNISTMVDELENLNTDESAPNRDEKARARRKKNTRIAQSAHSR
ncbi:Uncharacterized protein Adt_04555 [Abeliophyllum distichum]|uniref:Uncharacterized protein n=1 Tax=Abeliophyllum distichum TaxID=126358 RepID=A0ABD1V1L4_9LAMI